MNLGAFSISLSVKNLQASKNFYEKLGFQAFGGSEEQHYLIMKNGNSLIGLFEGMFEGNILTFNPGWNENAQKLNVFDDIRDIQAKLEAAEINFNSKAEPSAKGPANFMIEDPDGNVILVDQHF
ncbi:VOC family protein [Persicobacter diffluens]|uniref:Glyoxalase/fosfomycin resistance/dioxygenase domain-containing protein n=1 Tax=Persicobacter diffluens TaxID=981 RepID=A0AAN4W1L0_9BACT|nr:hypothetical protein PEDI_33870 [Persicobacter diffluens]